MDNEDVFVLGAFTAKKKDFCERILAGSQKPVNKARPSENSALKWIKHSMLISFYDDLRVYAYDACDSTFSSYAIS